MRPVSVRRSIGPHSAVSTDIPEARMKRLYPAILLSLATLAALTASVEDAVLAQPRVLRIIAFGAHPDDAEQKAGGVAAQWAAQGHKVKFVSMTNGDVGHFAMAGGPLARRRKAEVEECA